MRLSGVQSSRLSQITTRRLRSIPPPSQDDDIFANSLRKTLDAHRTSNRARLIRKTYPRAPSPGLFRPYIPPENRAGYQPPPPPEIGSEEGKAASVKKRSRRRAPETNTHETDARPERNAIRTVGDGASGRISQTPWLSSLPNNGAPGDASAYLDAEIQALHRYLAPSPDEQNQVTQLGAMVSALLEPIVPQKPTLIGSRRTGLALAHSDLDFLLPFEDLPRSLDRTRRPSPTRPQIRDAHLNLLRQVETALQNTPEFKDQVRLSGKRSLVLEARHRPTGLSLQFYCGERVPAFTEYLQDYLVEYPSLRPLYATTRALLEARGLFGPSQAGISPDALAMLLVAFLKINHGRFPGPHRLGDQLLAFLQLYGTDVDLQSVGVAVDPPGFFDAGTLRNIVIEESAYLRGQRSLIAAKRTAAGRGNLPASRRLCVQDPTHYMNDLGRSCTRTPELQSVFATAYDQLRSACDSWESSREESSILTKALRAKFDGLEKMREQIVHPQTC
ncbi:uncharacterized protein N7473_009034 [Penicillium subrubescens]|uniref:Non-canonical poly(A) RNA polymerase PAPD5 n=1 Tax=Penicillium subrubescens TaxID=1316194 RepID=A0A1Q5TRM4_9EURO|nr:uncharacterized protein N7473_009034 [Penicillium subrubescens]KAJ5886360.1 hypothetical protein N7473_009034 [Penicillium subrubescens]OKP02876.1 Non-canonical poly(A) RNA polymerase PAPD5 [Penicillium subrubescens]